MELAAALERDILAVLRSGGEFLPVYDVIRRVAPLRETEVRVSRIRSPKEAYRSQFMEAVVIHPTMGGVGRSRGDGFDKSSCCRRALARFA